jgi:transcriptional regulator GlxA family with amidase domain
MTKSATIFTPSAAPLSLAVLVLPQASILEVACVLDPMRAANRHLGFDAFRWRVVSPSGAAVPLTCGLELPAVGGIEAARGAEALVVVAGYQQAEVATRPLISALRRLAAGFALIVGIDAGPWVLARAGLLDGHRATVHWEDLEDFAAAYPGIDVVPERFVISGRRVSVAGAAPAVDFLLHLIGARHGVALALQVANSFLMTARPGTSPQIAQPGRDSALARDPRVAAAIARMEARLDAPEPTATTARALGLSVRRLEDLFRQELGTTPAAHGRDLRLQAARRMLTDTDHDLTEIALRTGFGSASALSRAFRARFSSPPGALRRRRGQSGAARAVAVQP